MNARAKRRQQTDAPVAQVVAEALDDDGAVGREGARYFALLGQVIEQVLRRELVEHVLVAQGLLCLGPAARALTGRVTEIARHLTQGAAQLNWAARTIA